MGTPTFDAPFSGERSMTTGRVCPVKPLNPTKKNQLMSWSIKDVSSTEMAGRLMTI